jgi:predicted TIM-barrel fold metal-dependent hydrolase
LKDIHVHVGPWPFDVRETTLPQVQKEMKKSGVERFAVMMSAPSGSAFVHSRNLSVLREAEGLDFIYYLDPRTVSINDLDSIAYKVAAVKLHPSYTRTRIDSPKMAKFLDWCESNSKPLLVHTGRFARYSSFKYPVDLATQRKMTIILAHMGGPAYDLAANCLDYISTKRPRGRLMVDTSGLSAPYLIEKAVKVLGGENVLFGSDFPLCHPGPASEAVLLANIPGAVKQSIMDGNYERQILR